MYCTNCGQKLPDDAAFCTKCGAKVTSSVAEPEHEAIRATRDTASNTTPSISQQNDSTTKFNKDLIGKIIFFLIVVGGLFAYMYYAPIKRGDYFARVKFFRGEPVKVEKNVAVYVYHGDSDVFVDLYEYPDIVIVTEPEDDTNGFNRVYGFVPVDKYAVIDFSNLSMVKDILKLYGINEEHEHIKLVMFSQPVEQIKEFPLQIKSESKKSESKSNTIKKDDPETVKQPEVAQNPANNNVPVVPPQQNSGEHYPGSDVYPSGTMRHRITGTDVNMRSGPGRNYDVIGSFDKGEIVVEIEYELSKDSWAKVRRRNGKTGWVSGRYCEMVKEPQINYPMYISAAEALYDFHVAITKKDYGKAYNNLLAPDMQRYIGPYDKFVQGYSTTISSSVEETNPISTGGSTVVMEYLLEAKDQLQSGISVQFFKGTANLQKVNGVWKIVEVTAKKTDRNTLLD
jgi:hypothetical protein